MNDCHVISQWGDSDDIIDQKNKIQIDINNTWPWILTFNTVICNVKFLLGQSCNHMVFFFFFERRWQGLAWERGKKKSRQFKTRLLGFESKKGLKSFGGLRLSYQVSCWCQVCFLWNIWTNFISSLSLRLFTTWVFVKAFRGGSQTSTSEILSIWSTTWVGKALWWQGWGADSRCCCEKDGISRAVIRIATSGCSRYFSKCQAHEDLKECAKKHVACSSWSKSGLSGSLSITPPHSQSRAWAPWPLPCKALATCPPIQLWGDWMNHDGI